MLNLVYTRPELAAFLLGRRRNKWRGLWDVSRKRGTALHSRSLAFKRIRLGIKACAFRQVIELGHHFYDRSLYERSYCEMQWLLGAARGIDAQHLVSKEGE